jgi:hypothetical protein
MLPISARVPARFSGSLPVPYTPLLDVSYHLLIRAGVTPLNFVLFPPAECPLSLPGDWEEEGKTREEEGKTRGKREIGYNGAILSQVGNMLGNGCYWMELDAEWNSRSDWGEQLKVISQ